MTTMLPVLIIPGFMSSGLEIQHSELKPDWAGKRIWINLHSLGFSAITGGNKSGTSSSHHGPSSTDGGSFDNKDESLELHNEYTNMWLQHMALSLEDQTTEHPQVQVRAMKGLGAVDYLTPGALTNHVSYVFGPVIRALLNVGYKEGVNLDAASYDWRLTPAAMEERDGYFSDTKKKVEEMYEANGKTPVVLLCHSLGAKVGHYFLNFCEGKEPGWCAKYIHTYVPVGGPHLGAPKAIRGIVTGDKMGLDVFLSDKDALALARSFGSTPWLVPRELPSGAPCPCFIHKQGVVKIRIHQVVDVTPLLKDRASSSVPTKLKLAVQLGKSVATSDFLPIQDMSVLLEGTFTFATTPEEPSDKLTIAVLEPGVNLARRKERKPREKCCGECYVPLWIKLLFCWHIVRYSIEWSFRLAACLLHWWLWKVWVSGADIISTAAGGSSVLAVAKPIKLKNIITSSTTETDIDVDLLDSSPNWKCCRKKERFTLTISVTWIPPDKRIQRDIRASIAKLKDQPSSLESFGRIESTKLKKSAVEACSGYVLLKKENLNQTLRTIERSYNPDPNEPRQHTTDGAPPVGRILAIYGINLPTEIGAVYRRHGCVTDSNVTNYFTLDTHARFEPENNDGYTIEYGVVMETKSTMQPSLNGGKRSGDGTVPYYSMQHVRTWENSCNVTVKELEGADHREILADERFHKIVIDYVTRKSSVVGDDAV